MSNSLSIAMTVITFFEVVVLGVVVLYYVAQFKWRNSAAGPWIMFGLILWLTQAAITFIELVWLPFEEALWGFIVWRTVSLVLAVLLLRWMIKISRRPLHPGDLSKLDRFIKDRD